MAHTCTSAHTRRRTVSAAAGSRRPSASVFVSVSVSVSVFASLRRRPSCCSSSCTKHPHSRHPCSYSALLHSTRRGASSRHTRFHTYTVAATVAGSCSLNPCRCIRPSAHPSVARVRPSPGIRPRAHAHARTTSAAHTHRHTPVAHTCTSAHTRRRTDSARKRGKL